MPNATLESSPSCGVALTPPYFQSPLSVDSAVRPLLWGCRPWANALRPWMFPPLLRFTRCFAQIHVEGIENLADLPGPVLFASNHQSHLDTYVIFAALPEQHRYRTAPSIRDQVFAGNTSWLRMVHRLRYYFTVVHLNGFTLPPNLALRRTLRHMAALAGHGWSMLIYPEGDRAATPEMLPFQEGVGFFAHYLSLPVVPIRIDGTFGIFPRAPRTGKVRVRFGRPLYICQESRATITRRVEAAIHGMA